MTGNNDMTSAEAKRVLNQLLADAVTFIAFELIRLKDAACTLEDVPDEFKYGYFDAITDVQQVLAGVTAGLVENP